MTRTRNRFALLALPFLLTASLAGAAGLSDALETKVFEWLVKQTAFGTAPSTMCFALSSADPGDTCANELASSGSYARVCLTPDANNSTNTNYNATATSGTATQLSNKVDLTFPTATADWNSAAAIKWWFAISSSSGAGTCYMSGPVNGTTGTVVLSGNQLKFTGGTPGQLTFTVD